MSVCFFISKSSQKGSQKTYLVRYITQRFERKEKNIDFSLTKNLQCRRGEAEGAGDWAVTQQDPPTSITNESLHELGVKSDIESSGERLYKLADKHRPCKYTKDAFNFKCSVLRCWPKHELRQLKNERPMVCRYVNVSKNV